MASHYQPTDTHPSVNPKTPAADEGIKLSEWLIIVAFLIVAMMGYGYYQSYKNDHRPAPDQPVASDNSDTIGGVASSANNPTPPNP